MVLQTSDSPDSQPKISRGADFKIFGPQSHRHGLRQIIDSDRYRAESDIIQSFQAMGIFDRSIAPHIDSLARHFVTQLRQASDHRGRSGLVQNLMQEYALSTDEGVALMCLAEALLRIPDDKTRDALIRDKIAKGDWDTHLGHSSSLFVNATSWGLLLTGKLVNPENDHQRQTTLRRLLIKSGEPLIRKGVELAIEMLGDQFVTGETIEQALSRSKDMEELGFLYSYDMLGEAALTEEDAQRYFKAYEQAIHAIGKATQGKDSYTSSGISIKLSALHPCYHRKHYQRVMNELYPRVLYLAELSRDYEIGLNIDAEEVERLDLSLDILESLCHAPSLKGWSGLGFVIQAYQKRCSSLVDFVIDLAKKSERRLMIRLVKGAYWDSEIKKAQIEGYCDYPVFTRKHHTDLSYLVCARKLLAAPESIYPQFATHNAHTVASIIHFAEKVLGPYEKGHYEFQCLYGMGEPLYRHIVGHKEGNRPCRIYAPVGTHKTLLAYLVRRLLENGANSSFVNRMADSQISMDDLVKNPLSIIEEEACDTESILGDTHPKIPLPPDLYGQFRKNSRGFDLSHEPTLRDLSEQFYKFSHPITILPLIEGAVESTECHAILNPADQADHIGTVFYASPHDIEQAIDNADKRALDWSFVSPQIRADRLEKAADLLEKNHAQAMALLIREAGKSWSHAGAELREAVDFLRYYAAQAKLICDDRYRPLGPVVCISPWNFPLAIFIGQIAAALVAGNPVLAKPAESTTAIAAFALELLWQAGIPHSAVQLLPGKGSDVGAKLIDDDRIQAVMFTGSTQTAKFIQKTLSKRLNSFGQAIPLIAETGGQNCMIVESSALLEQVVQDVIASTFDAAGQRCSALRVLCVQEDIADRLIAMIKGAMAEIHVGPPASLNCDMGSVIDYRAKERLEKHVLHWQAQASPVYRLYHPDSEKPEGSWVSPTMIEIQSLSDLPEEIFGPILHILRYPREGLFDLLESITSTGYALTLGIHSRIQETIDHIIARSQAGNIYVNRSMVGAVVGVQPFGGHGLSGTGPKAGGPLYLLRLFSQTPEEALFKSLQGPSQTVIEMTSSSPALTALHDWALEQKNSELAQMCGHFAHSLLASCVCHLRGPTGELNHYSVKARSPILSLTGDYPQAEQDLLIQLAAILAVRSKALWESRWSFLRKLLPPNVQEHIECKALLSLESPQLVIHHGSEEEALNLAQDIAHREEVIIPLILLRPHDSQIPSASLLLEQTISINTAAAGGNTSLMMIED